MSAAVFVVPKDDGIHSGKSPDDDERPTAATYLRMRIMQRAGIKAASQRRVKKFSLLEIPRTVPCQQPVRTRNTSVFTVRDLRTDNDYADSSSRRVQPVGPYELPCLAPLCVGKLHATLEG